jgi:hypothetical protein
MNKMDKAKKMNTSHVAMPSTDKHKLILTRKLGLKVQLPGSGQWEIMTRDFDVCWICEQHVLAVFIWSEEIGEREQVVDFIYEEFFEEEIERINGNSDKTREGSTSPQSPRSLGGKTPFTERTSTIRRALDT